MRELHLAEIPITFGEIYRGRVFRISANEKANQAADRAMELAESTGLLAMEKLANKEFYECQLKTQKLLQKDQLLKNLLLNIIHQYTNPHFYYQPPRLRAIRPDTHLAEEAANAFTAHRDTWYGNPRCQLNWWLALVDITIESSFLFFPGFFQRPVKNSSGSFDYRQWKENKAAVFPTVQEPLPAGTPFHCQRGDLLVFSAAHLHQSQPNLSGRARYSIDFRSVDINEHRAGLGAANVDNLAKEEFHYHEVNLC